MKNNKEAVEILRGWLDKGISFPAPNDDIKFNFNGKAKQALSEALLALEKLDRLEKWLDERILIEDNKHKKKLKSERTGIFVSETTVKRRQLLKVLREVREVLQNEK